MSHWITVYSFPISKDLSALFRLIQRYQLPLRIAEEENQQALLTTDSGIAELLKPLLQDWERGLVDLDRVQLTKAEPEDGDHLPGEEGQAPKEKTPVSPSFLPTFPMDKTPISLLLIGLCFFGWFLHSNNLSAPLLIYPDTSGGPLFSQSSLMWHLERGEFWRLWTPAIINLSFQHALFNALAIWILGRPLEARGGPFIYSLLVLLGGIAANLSQYAWKPEVIFAGMSGVVYTLVGFTVVMQRWQPAWRDIPPGIITLAIVWMILCVLGVITYFTGIGIANAAHLGGFFAGFLIALVYCVAGGARKFNSYPAST
ncbi:rhomboid family intramembrane serine protease [Microbulbifer sp. JTAC008]|uniref:rhomboid family intramembrane serine protease n=1 Tax=unclassified Microbulbifer TaxID=2619833 RepID=UPI00403A0196